MNKKKITLCDNINILDNVGYGINNIYESLKDSMLFKGFFRLKIDDEIIKDNNALPEGFYTNMALASGREFCSQTLVKKFSIDSVFGNIYNYKLDSFGIGSGGSTDNGDIVTLLGPELGDKGLYTPVPINSNCLSVKDNNSVEHPNIVKFVESEGAGLVAGTITFEKSNNIEFLSLSEEYFTVIKLNCVVDQTEPSYLETDEDSVKISEAMLFITNDSNINPIPFAHCCFAPKWIEKGSKFEIEWYIIT